MSDLITEGKIRTYTGRHVDLLNPSPDAICIEDIAHALSNECRFGGHSSRFYSVAEHCLIGVCFLDAAYKLEWLLHDASEAYLKDIPKPLKMLPQFAFYRDLESRWESAIAEVFGLPKSFSPQIKQIDKRMLVTEQMYFLGRQPRLNDPATLPVLFGDLPYVGREQSFLKLFHVLNERGAA